MVLFDDLHVEWDHAVHVIGGGAGLAHGIESALGVGDCIALSEIGVDVLGKREVVATPGVHVHMN
jgi:hypothetical protein